MIPFRYSDLENEAIAALDSRRRWYYWRPVQETGSQPEL